LDGAAVGRADERSGADHLLEVDVGHDVGESGHAEQLGDRAVGLPPGGHDHGSGREVGALAALVEGDLEPARFAGHGGDLGAEVHGDAGMGDDGVDEFADPDGFEFPVRRSRGEQLGKTGRPAAEFRLALDEVDVVP
jgi:hypothetical protein